MSFVFHGRLSNIFVQSSAVDTHVASEVEGECEDTVVGGARKTDCCGRSRHLLVSFLDLFETLYASLLD